MEFWLCILGFLAGGLTTVAGMGGGVMLVLALSLVASPVEALAITSPALLIGNLHRVAVGRRAIDRAVARPFVLGALPGSLLGGLLSSTFLNLLVVPAGFALFFHRRNFRAAHSSEAPLLP